jgi:hypothetical protein
MSNPFGDAELGTLNANGTANLSGSANLSAPSFTSPPVGGMTPTTFGSAGGGLASRATEYLPSILQGSSHPFVAFFHVAFKVLALTIYLVGRYMFGSYVMTFIIVVLCLAFDFWTVKNVTGRILVGLRWWSNAKDDGTTEWVFESRDERQPPPHPTDSFIFWGALYSWPLIWAIFLVLNVISFSVDWLVLVVMALTFATSNLAGYWKCSKDQKSKMQDAVASWGIGLAKSGFAQSIANRFS